MENMPEEVEKLFFRSPHEIVVIFKEHKGRTDVRHYENNMTRYSYDENNKFVKEGKHDYKTEVD